MNPVVDIVIAVHDPSRPVERAVRSALSAADGGTVRVTVVVHNTAPDPVLERLGTLAEDPRVRFITLHDGIRSPAGPFNAGLDAATAEFTSVLGSDDELELGAITSWVKIARRAHADVVVARLRYADGGAVPTPPTRPGRSSHLDPVRDRLSYRSAPLGLVSRARFGALRFSAALQVGEDVPYVTRLWFSDARIAYDRRGPAYLIHTDVSGRTTVSARTIDEELAYIPLVLTDPWFSTLSTSARSAIVVKFVRIHVFGAVTNRSDPSRWTTADRHALARTTTELLGAGDGIERVLSELDRRVLESILDPTSPTLELLAAASDRRRFAHPHALLPRALSSALHREAPLRMMAASVLQLR